MHQGHRGSSPSTTAASNGRAGVVVWRRGCRDVAVVRDVGVRHAGLGAVAVLLLTREISKVAQEAVGDLKE